MNKEVVKKNTDKEQQSLNEKKRQLILINDDVHSFDYVSKALTDVCNHTIEQAIQCTTITHYKGRCSVKKGDFKTLKLMKKGLVDRELRAIIS